MSDKPKIPRVPSKKVPHPTIEGRWVSKQYLGQWKRRYSGKCINHASRDAVRGSKFCQICLTKKGVKWTKQEMRERWLEVDWTLPYAKIAKELEVTVQSVKNHAPNRAHRTWLRVMDLEKENKAILARLDALEAKMNQMPLP